MSEPKPGGNPSALTEAAQRAAESLNQKVGDLGAQAKPLITEAAERMADSFRSQAKSDLFKEISHKGAMAVGAAATVDGFRRLVQKDENGKRHTLRGTAQTAVGIGLFTAAVVSRRNNLDPDGQNR